MGVACDSCLHLADLFRLLRLFRHGDRARADVRHPPAGELPLALQGALDHRVLAALAHYPVALFARLSLHSARGQPVRHGSALPQFDAHDAARRLVAWCGLDLPDLGWAARPLSRREPPMARSQTAM